MRVWSPYLENRFDVAVIENVLQLDSLSSETKQLLRALVGCKCVLQKRFGAPQVLQECGSVLYIPLAQRPPVTSTTLAWSTETLSQAASCTTSCRSKCAHILRTVQCCVGMQTLADGCSLHSPTHAPLSHQLCSLCLRGSIQFKWHICFCPVFFLPNGTEKHLER